MKIQKLDEITVQNEVMMNIRRCYKILYILFLLSFGVIVEAETFFNVAEYRGVARFESAPHFGQPEQHALVVGINYYRAAELMNLSGAVNDAKLLRDALRQAGVHLPDERVLLDASATREAFIYAWQNMLKQAKPGDSLILTFAGHGGQEPDSAPFGEKDGSDETLMFYDFLPKQPSQGRITDDELYGIFEKARDYNILVVVDACHSSGMVRSARQPVGRFRSGGFWQIQPDAPPALPDLPKSGEGKRLAHVTMITAVDSDSLLVPETILGSRYHGALSWFFAEAIRGKADGNQNGRLERDELENFLTEKVSEQMNNLQMPKLLPRADRVSVFNLAQVSHSPVPALQPKVSDIAILVENGVAPFGLKHVRLVKAAYDLRFVVKGGQTVVFNQTGDNITSLVYLAGRWQDVIDKARFLKLLESQFDMRLEPIRFSLREGDGLHRMGEYLHFSLSAGDGLNALTLFSLAANGELQFLYPLSEYGDSLIVGQFPLILPPAQIVSPLGGENLVAVLCDSPARGLHALLGRVQPKLPDFDQFIGLLRENRCQVGQYAFFSGK